jgi:hypothetical protein
LFFFSIIATVFVNYLEIYYQLLFNLIYVVEDEILAWKLFEYLGWNWMIPEFFFFIFVIVQN